MLFQCITFAPLIVEMIINGVDPVGACTNIGVCLVGKQRPVPVVACELFDRNGALCPAAYVHRYLNRTLHHRVTLHVVMVYYMIMLSLQSVKF